MAAQLLALQYAGYAVELTALALLLRGRQWRRHVELFSYVALLFVTDAVTRPFVLNLFGASSLAYRYFYWLSDVVLALGMFLLIGAFFYQGCREHPELWRHVRLLLGVVLLSVVAVSCYTLSKNYDRIYSFFIIEFEQNLYFTCLVLNTLLFILLQHLKSTDDRLQLLVCGTGIQLAGPAAGWALIHLTPGWDYAGTLQRIISPLCTDGMLLVWLYAVSGLAKRVIASRTESAESAAVISSN